MIDEIEKKIRSLIQANPKLPVSVFSNPCWAGLEAMEWEFAGEMRAISEQTKEVDTLTRGLENAPERQNREHEEEAWQGEPQRKNNGRLSFPIPGQSSRAPAEQKSTNQ